MISLINNSVPCLGDQDPPLDDYSKESRANHIEKRKCILNTNQSIIKGCLRMLCCLTI